MPSRRKHLVETYFEGFRRNDHRVILACLHSDIIWNRVGRATLQGKVAFDTEIDNPGFHGHPVINLDTLAMEGDLVVALGTGHSTLTTGDLFAFAFSVAFTFRGDLISHITSYLIPLPQQAIDASPATR